MRLLVKRGLSLINNLNFADGPIYIGRLPKCKVFLPDRNVSRQHAVIYTTNDGVWMVQDLESSNCTTLNNRPIAKMPLHEGDIIGIADFAIEVHFETEQPIQLKNTPLDLDDTVVGEKIDTAGLFQTRSIKEGQTLHINSKRLHDFYDLNLSMICKNDQEEMLSALTNILLDQFDAYQIWAGLRETTTGPLTCHCGRTRGGTPITLEGIAGKDIIKESLHKESYLILPNFEEFAHKENSKHAGHIKSAMCAPIFAPAGVYGILYVNNGSDQDPYTHQDLDYLTLISTQVAAFLEHVG